MLLQSNIYLDAISSCGTLCLGKDCIQVLRGPVFSFKEIETLYKSCGATEITNCIVLLGFFNEFSLGSDKRSVNIYFENLTNEASERGRAPL